MFSFQNKLNQAMKPAGDSGSTNHRIAQSVQAASKKYGVPQELILAVIKQESAFKPNATSHCGAQGLMQLMPGTAKEMGVKDSYNIEQNIDGGTKYLGRMLKLFGGDKRLALAAYNAGPGAVMKYNNIPPYKETQNYVSRIMASLERGNVKIPNGLPAAPGRPVQGPQAPTLVAQYNKVDHTNGPRQVAFYQNTEMGASLAAAKSALADSLSASIVDNNLKIEVSREKPQTDKQEDKPLPRNAILA
jgi:hypothetical protein